MFARVITAQAGADGLGNAIHLAREQLPGARQQPGFKGFYLLTDTETGKIMTIRCGRPVTRWRRSTLRLSCIAEACKCQT